MRPSERTDRALRHWAGWVIVLVLAGGMFAVAGPDDVNCDRHPEHESCQDETTTTTEDTTTTTEADGHDALISDVALVLSNAADPAEVLTCDRTDQVTFDLLDVKVVVAAEGAPSEHWTVRLNFDSTARAANWYNLWHHQNIGVDSPNPMMIPSQQALGDEAATWTVTATVIGDVSGDGVGGERFEPSCTFDADPQTVTPIGTPELVVPPQMPGDPTAPVTGLSMILGKYADRDSILKCDGTDVITDFRTVRWEVTVRVADSPSEHWSTLLTMRSTLPAANWNSGWDRQNVGPDGRNTAGIQNSQSLGDFGTSADFVAVAAVEGESGNRFELACPFSTGP